MIAGRLKELVGLYPETKDQLRVKKLLDNIGSQLTELGLEVTPIEYNGKHSIYAHPKGSKSSKLLLEGHVDVVPASNQPFKVNGDKLFGRGVYDMLFAIACYLELLNELKDHLPNLDLGIMLTGDEEFGGTNGVQKLLRDRYSTEVCVVPDAGDDFGSLSVAAKGIYTLSIHINGTAHHGSRPWEGDSATTKLVHLLAKIETIFDTSSRDNSTITIAKLQAGDAENKGPAYADCTLDIRYKDRVELERIKTKLEPLFKQFDAVITKAKDGTDYRIDVNNTYVQSFIKQYELCIGKKVKLTKAHGSSDARYFVERGIPVIMLRPDGGGAHGDNEWISSASIDKFYGLLKNYVLDTLSEH